MRLIFIILLALFSFPAKAQRLSQRDTITDVYRGVLPCADCIGIDTKLVLIHERFAGMGSFVLTETYMYRGDTVRLMETNGEWTHHRGSAADRNHTVVELFNNTGDQFRYYLLQKDNNLKMLDKELKEINSEANYVLKREN